VESGGDELGASGVGQEVAGDLLDGETVKGQIGVERVDHPVAVGPDAARLVIGVALGVGVARQIKPAARPVLAVGGLRQLTIDVALVGSGRGVSDKRLHFLQRRRQAGQIQCHPAREHGTSGFRLRFDSRPLQRCDDEPVDRAARPSGVAHHRRLRPHRRLVGPVTRVGRSTRDPSPQGIDLGRSKRLTALRWRHQLIGVGRDQALQQFALVWLTGHDRERPAAQVLERTFAGIQPQALLPALSPVLVGPVTQETIVGQDRANVAVEIRHIGRASIQRGDKQGDHDG